MKAPECPVARHAAARPADAALAFQGRRWSWRDLDEEVTAAEQHVRPGGRNVLVAHNTPETVFRLFAAARRRAWTVVIHPGLAAPEARARMAQSQVGAPAAGPAVVVFTSGTTGTPRGAILSTRALQASAAASAQVLGTDAGSRWLCNLPLCHVGGLAMLWRVLHDGAFLELHPRFDPRMTAAALQHDGITHASLVGTTLLRLLDGTPVWQHALRAVLVGGGPARPDVVTRARAAGVPVRLTYGLTEGCSQVTTQRAPRGLDAGLPLPGTTVRIVDDAGSPAATGGIELRGPTLFDGYLDDPRATAAAHHDGWLRTGDVGSLDAEGRLTVHCRRTDLVLRGGENVYPAEVEAVLLAHPAVQDAAVLPEEHARLGQVPVALVVAGADEAVLRAWCADRLARFKVPERFRFVAALPRTALGKLDRAALRGLAGGPSG
ncbi:MAG: AMP-binding protein [Deltaproteobacteria bacterium]|nr:AMP-binding protein [Deltaproteobacteria bacterium]